MACTFMMTLYSAPFRFPALAEAGHSVHLDKWVQNDSDHSTVLKVQLHTTLRRKLLGSLISEVNGGQMAP